jgi:L-asparaginase II
LNDVLYAFGVATLARVPSPAPLVRVVRSGLEESVHAGHVAVCDADGRLIAAAGDPDRRVFARSSMKPIQASVSLGRIGADVPDELVAISTASHHAEPRHLTAVRRLLRAGGVTESALRCPPALPAHADDIARTGARRRRLFYNCSGKHAAMLAASAATGWALETYVEPQHPLQREIRTAVARATDVNDPTIGVDGCGVPVFGLPLRAMATAFARLARPERLGSIASNAERVVSAMRAHPFLIAGTNGADTMVMEAARDVVCKYGAEALHCAALLDRGVGVAVKIADGSERAAGPALVHALALIEALSADERERLEPLARRPVLGGGRPVGEMVADFRLSRPR